MSNNVPKLRFKGFDGKWINKKLKSIVGEIESGNRLSKDNLMSGNVPYIVAQTKNNGIFQFIDENTKDYNGNEMKKFSKNSITFSIDNPKAMFIQENDFFTSNIMRVIHSDDLSFEQYVFILESMRTFIRSYDWSRKFSGPVVSNLIIKTPSNDEEQEKIGLFFKILDQLIFLQEKKIALLKEQKKGFLQKLFPKAGAKVPELRFADFDGDWEERRLGNHSEILTGGTPKTSILQYWEPKTIPWMSSGEVNKGRLDETDNFISDEGLCNSSARWVKENSVLIALAGQGKTRGTVAINNIPITTNQSLAAIVPDDSLYYEFIFQNLIKRYDELRMISSGDGTRGGLNKQIVSDIIVPFSNKDEQIKIGDIFKNIDTLITLHNHKIDNLKEQKKGLLQMMFI